MKWTSSCLGMIGHSYNYRCPPLYTTNQANRSLKKGGLLNGVVSEKGWSLERGGIPTHPCAGGQSSMCVHLPYTMQLYTHILIIMLL